MLKYKILPMPAVLMLTCLLPALSVHGAQLKSYRDVSNLAFTLADIKDQTHSLNDYKGKVVLVNFWASWCPPCIHEMPALKKLKKNLTGQPFEILAINVGEKKYKVRKFSNVIKLDLPVLLDTSSTTFNDWDVKTLPTSFLVDATGNVRYRVLGNPGWDNIETTSIIDNLLTEASKPAAENNENTEEK